MIALDTNVLVRVLTGDDPAQAERATRLLRSGDLSVSKTVLLETEWVLRYTYEHDGAAINLALTTLLGLEELTVEDRPAVQAALAWHAGGMDFADALHLASAGPSRSFATFDQRLAKAAEGASGAPRVELLHA